MASINDLYPSKNLSAADLNGRHKTFTITSAEPDMVGQGDDAKRLLFVSFEETEKRLGLNKTNAQAISGFYGDDYLEWKGEQVVLFPTRVDFSGKMVDAVRVDEKLTRVVVQAKLRAVKAAPATPRKQTKAEIDAELGPDPDEDLPF